MDPMSVSYKGIKDPTSREEYEIAKRDYQYLIEEINRTLWKVNDAKEGGSSLIRVSAIADPISDVLRDLRQRLFNLSNEQAEAYRQFLMKYGPLYEPRY